MLRKAANPTWTPPASIRAEYPWLPRVVPAGPDNPLGAHAIYLGWPSYLIHGTNVPAVVGRRTSHGCIRMYPADIARLFAQVKSGMRVTVVNQPVKAGWHDGELYLEVHPTINQIDELELSRTFIKDALPDVVAIVRAAAGEADMRRVDMRRLYQMAMDRTGVPQRIMVLRQLAL